jgi:oxygen-dependent protoporphyrinogen oxidase
VVLACPAPHCHALLREAAPVVARALHAIRFASCVTVNLVYRHSDLTHLPDEFGFFVPRKEPYRILAATFASEKFPARATQGHVVVRAFQGGALDPGAVDLDDATLSRRAHDDLAQLIGATHRPLSTHVHRFRHAMPQFDVGHLSRVADLRAEIARHRGLHVVGSGMSAYGLPDCVTSGEEAAEVIQRGR